MKKMIILLTLSLIFYGCSFPSADEIIDDCLREKASGHSLYDTSSLITSGSVGGTVVLIGCLVGYKSEAESEDVWQNPKTTLELGTGDCEDFAILFLNAYYFSTGIKGNLLLVYENRQVVEGGTINHCIVEINGVQYDPQSGRQCNYTIGYRFSFNEVFN